jgi:hypothetical protein
MNNRARLQNRRGSTTFSFECNGLQYIATFSRFSDGRPAEIFLNNTKGGSAADTAARDSAIACSFALQHGADIDVIRRALSRDGNGEPCGPLAAALDRLEVLP